MLNVLYNHTDLEISLNRHLTGITKNRYNYEKMFIYIKGPDKQKK